MGGRCARTFAALLGKLADARLVIGNREARGNSLLKNYNNLAFGFKLVDVQEISLRGSLRSSVNSLTLDRRLVTARRERLRIREMSLNVLIGVAALLGELVCTSSTDYVTASREGKNNRKIAIT